MAEVQILSKYELVFSDVLASFVCKICHTAIRRKECISAHAKMHTEKGIHDDDMRRLKEASHYFLTKYRETEKSKQYWNPCKGKLLSNIPELPIFAVTQCLECRSYLMPSSLRTHIASKHSNLTFAERKNVQKRSEECSLTPCQTLFPRGKGKNYFPVTSIEVSADVLGHVRVLLGKRKRSEDDLLRNNIAYEDRTQNAFSEGFKVLQYLDGYGIMPRVAHSITCLDSFDKSSTVKSIICKYFAYFCDMKPPVPLYLRNLVQIEGGQKFVLSIEEKSRKRYAASLARFFCAAYNLARKQDHLSLPQSIIRGALQFAQCIQSGEKSERKLLDSAHSFLKVLLLTTTKVSSGKRVPLEDLFMLIVGGFEVTSTSRIRVAHADDATHILAAIQYSIQVVAIGEFLEAPIGFGTPRDTDCDTQAEKHIQQCISIRSGTPSAYVRSALPRCFSISISEVPRIIFAADPENPDIPCGIIRNKRIMTNSNTPGSLGFATRSLQNDANIIIDKLLCGYKFQDNFKESIQNFSDNLLDKEAGYYFGDHPSNQVIIRALQEQLLAYICSCPSSPIFLSKDNPKAFVLSQHAPDWLDSVYHLKKIVYTLIHVAGGAPPRSTELVNGKIRNTATAKRNFFIVQGKVCTVITYTKLQKSRSPKPIARFLDYASGIITIKYILFLVLIESVILECMHETCRGNEDFFFSRKGKIIKKEIIYTAFRSSLRKYGVDLGVEEYRHYYEGITKRFGSRINSLRQMLNEEDAEHIQAGHTSMTANNRYAPSELDFTNLRGDELLAFRLSSER